MGLMKSVKSLNLNIASVADKRSHIMDYKLSGYHNFQKFIYR